MTLSNDILGFDGHRTDTVTSFLRITFATGFLLDFRESCIFAPLMGCDAISPVCSKTAFPFQPTHPVRGATAKLKSTPKKYKFQSTHPVRGATGDHSLAQLLHLISIHAPREGCDPLAILAATRSHIFQSTHPVRGATQKF